MIILIWEYRRYFLTSSVQEKDAINEISNIDNTGNIKIHHIRDQTKKQNTFYTEKKAFGSRGLNPGRKSTTLMNEQSGILIYDFLAKITRMRRSIKKQIS